MRKYVLFLFVCLFFLEENVFANKPFGCKCDNILECTCSEGWDIRIGDFDTLSKIDRPETWICGTKFYRPPEVNLIHKVRHFKSCNINKKYIYRKVPSKRPWAVNYLPPYSAHWALAQLTGPLLQVTLAIFLIIPTKQLSYVMHVSYSNFSLVSKHFDKNKTHYNIIS